MLVDLLVMSLLQGCHNAIEFYCCCEERWMQETKRRGGDLWKNGDLFYCCDAKSLQLKMFMDSSRVLNSVLSSL